SGPGRAPGDLDGGDFSASSRQAGGDRTGGGGGCPTPDRSLQAGVGRLYHLPFVHVCVAGRPVGPVSGEVAGGGGRPRVGRFPFHFAFVRHHSSRQEILFANSGHPLVGKGTGDSARASFGPDQPDRRRRRGLLPDRRFPQPARSRTDRGDRRARGPFALRLDPFGRRGAGETLQGMGGSALLGRGGIVARLPAVSRSDAFTGGFSRHG